jgi:hypothetical protein
MRVSEYEKPQNYRFLHLLRLWPHRKGAFQAWTEAHGVPRDRCPCVSVACGCCRVRANIGLELDSAAAGTAAARADTP